MKPREGREHIEEAHFDRLAGKEGEIWWGSATAAGAERLRRRALLVASELEGIGDPVVLELGCGTGAFSQFILEVLPELCLRGIDISPNSVEVAAERLQQYANAVFERGSALQLDRLDDSVDAVVGNSVLHHLPLQKCVGEAFRVLKPGGRIWFSEPNMMNPQIAVEKNVKFIGRMLQNTPDETAFFRWPLAGVLCDAGFKQVKVSPFDFLHPAVPKPFMRLVDGMGKVLERVPLVREIAGSLIITAEK